VIKSIIRVFSDKQLKFLEDKWLQYTIMRKLAIKLPSLSTKLHGTSTISFKNAQNRLHLLITAVTDQAVGKNQRKDPEKLHS
jgi:hypothetical protein